MRGELGNVICFQCEMSLHEGGSRVLLDSSSFLDKWGAGEGVQGEGAAFESPCPAQHCRDPAVPTMTS
jgi:hypothetical protein